MSEESHSKPPSPLYIRTSDEQRDFLKDIARKTTANGSVNTLIVRLIDRLIGMKRKSESELLEFLSSGIATSVEKTSQLMERVAWGNTAFERGHYAWSIEEFQRLDAEAWRDAPGAWRLAQYKLSYSWSEIAGELRRFAIDNRTDKSIHKHWNEIFDAIDWALCASLVYNSRHDDDDAESVVDPKHPVMAFNAACVWSQRAQYEVERQLAEPVVKFAGHERREMSGSKRDSPLSWRRRLQKAPGVLQKVEAYHAHAMDKLRSLSSSKHKKPPRDVGFLLRLAQTDVDLSFFRDSEFFERWMSEHRSSNSIFDTFLALRDSVPSDIKKQVDVLRQTGAKPTVSV